MKHLFIILFYFCGLQMFAQNYQPYGESLKYQPYDIEKEYQIKNNSYAKDMIYEFRQKYYPSQDWKWMKGDAFRYKATNDNKEVFVGWVSWADGIQWHFFITETEKCSSKSMLCFIENDKVKKRIFEFISKKRVLVIDAFKQTSYTFETDQKTKNILFPEISEFKEKQVCYGVYTSKTFYLFDESGNYIPK